MRLSQTAGQCCCTLVVDLSRTEQSMARHGGEKLDEAEWKAYQIQCDRKNDTELLEAVSTFVATDSEGGVDLPSKTHNMTTFLRRRFKEGRSTHARATTDTKKGITYRKKRERLEKRKNGRSRD